MEIDSDVKKALDVLKAMGYEIREFDKGYIACILSSSKVQESKSDEQKN